MVEKIKKDIQFALSHVHLRQTFIRTIKLSLYVLICILNTIKNLCILKRIFLKESFLVQTIINNLFCSKIRIVTKILKTFSHSFSESLTSFLIRLRQVLFKLFLSVLNISTFSFSKMSKLSNILLLIFFKTLNICVLCFLCRKQSIFRRSTSTCSLQLSLCRPKLIYNRVTCFRKRFFRCSYCVLCFLTNSIPHHAFTLTNLSERIYLSKFILIRSLQIKRSLVRINVRNVSSWCSLEQVSHYASTTRSSTNKSTSNSSLKHLVKVLRIKLSSIILNHTVNSTKPFLCVLFCTFTNHCLGQRLSRLKELFLK